MTIQSIIQWFDTAKPEPTNQDLLKQIAFHCEEFAEMMDALKCEQISKDVRVFKEHILSVSEHKGLTETWVNEIDHLALLDACADQVVTSTGVAVFAGMDFEPALAEVNRSNYTKFAKDDNGRPVPYIRPDGKIGKNPETYQDPELEPFLTRNKGDQE